MAWRTTGQSGIRTWNPITTRTIARRAFPAWRAIPQIPRALSALHRRCLLGETIGRAFDKLGWHWWVSDNAMISQPYQDCPACDLHGKCMFGCPIGAKASTDVTYWPKALRQGALLKTRARLREIAVDKAGRAAGAIYYDREGKLREQLARVVVLSANGIGTPRLLLNSKSGLFPNGLANSSGLVGKRFMVHPFRFYRGCL